MIEKLLNETCKAVENRINELLPDSEQKYKSVVSASRYSLLNGGKRIRPAILLEFYKLCGGKEKSAIDFAVALEMIHTYSLIHDDLPCMDNDDLRRGKPSCHIKYGEATALLAGDALLTEAFKIASSTKGIDSASVLKAINVLSNKAGINGMVGGQVIDLMIENTNADIDTIRDMYLMKTGALLEAAATIGCILSGASNDKVSAANEYGSCVGLAFQIIDDILDNIGNQQLLGKTVGSDCKNNKTTFVAKYGIEQCRKLAAELTEKALLNIKLFDGDTTNLTELTKYLLIREY